MANLSESQLDQIFLKGGMYSDNEGWLTEDEVSDVADLVPGVVNADGDFITSPRNVALVALQCLRIIRTRGVEEPRATAIQQRIRELIRELQGTMPASSGGSAPTTGGTDEVTVNRLIAAGIE